MKKLQKLLTFFLLILLTKFMLPAQDVGLVLDQTAEFSAHGGEFTDSALDYSGILIPRFFALAGDNAEFIISAGLNYEFAPAAFVPELLRTDFTMRFGMGELKAGRMPYQDPSGLIAGGLFDGVHFSYDTKAGTLNAGGWYTGFLYKERAAIEMTDNERQLNNTKVNYDDFVNTYFAPRRALASVGWEHSSLGGGVGMRLELLGQFDLTDADLNTQYFSAKITLPFTRFMVDLGGCFELIEHSEELTMAMAGEAGFTWLPPGSFEQLVSLRGRFSNGVIEENSLGAFLPLTTIPQGNLLKTKLSGLSIISMDYTARLHHAFAASIDASYFIRSDPETYTQYPLMGVNSEGFFMGMELYGKIIWSLSSEIQMNLGLGAFMPSLGNAAPDADTLWRAELNAVLLLF